MDVLHDKSGGRMSWYVVGAEGTREDRERSNERKREKRVSVKFHGGETLQESD
jgi:hypothetical protein